MQPPVKDAHEEWVSKMSGVLKNKAPGRHVFDRLATLLCYEDVVWVDGEIKDVVGGFTGSFSVFTETLVAVVDIRNEPHSRGEGFTRVGESNCEVSVLARRSLQHINLAQDEENPRINSRPVWDRRREDGQLRDGWPWEAPLVLTYADGSRITVSGRVSEDAEANLSDLMPSLLRDLVV